MAPVDGAKFSCGFSEQIRTAMVCRNGMVFPYRRMGSISASNSPRAIRKRISGRFLHTPTPLPGVRPAAGDLLPENSTSGRLGHIETPQSPGLADPSLSRTCEHPCTFAPAANSPRRLRVPLQLAFDCCAAWSSRGYRGACRLYRRQPAVPRCGDKSLYSTGLYLFCLSVCL